MKKKSNESERNRTIPGEKQNRKDGKKSVSEDATPQIKVLVKA